MNRLIQSMGENMLNRIFRGKALVAWLGAVGLQCALSTNAFAYRQCQAQYYDGSGNPVGAAFNFAGQGSQANSGHGCSGDSQYPQGDQQVCMANAFTDPNNGPSTSGQGIANSVVMAYCNAGKQVPGGKVSLYLYVQAQGCGYQKSQGLFIGYCPAQKCTSAQYQPGTYFAN